MDGSSVIDTIKIGLEYILLAIFLVLAIRVIQIRNDCSNALNVRTITEEGTKEMLEFSQYNTGNNQNSKAETIPADEVLACIRNYRDGSVSIYVDNIGENEYVFDSTVAQSDDMNVRNRYTQKWLTNHMSMKKYYHPYLIYDNQDVKDATVYNKKGENVTGIAFLMYKN